MTRTCLLDHFIVLRSVWRDVGDGRSNFSRLLPLLFFNRGRVRLENRNWWNWKLIFIAKRWGSDVGHFIIRIRKWEWVTCWGDYELIFGKRDWYGWKCLKKVGEKVIWSDDFEVTKTNGDGDTSMKFWEKDFWNMLAMKI